MVEEATLNYRLIGSGPPLLLIHGFGVSFQIWRELAALLAAHFCLIAVELPGQGESLPPPSGHSYTETSVAAIESVRQKLGIPKWSLLAYSIGAGVAVAYTTAHPDRTFALVLVCPPLLKGWRWWNLRWLLWVDGRRSAIGDWLLCGWRLYWLVAMIGFNARPVSLASEWVEEIVRQPLPVLKACLREFPPAEQLLAGMDDQWLLVCGNRDIVSTRPPRRGVKVAHFAGDHSGVVRMAGPIAEKVIKFWCGRGIL